MSIANVNKDMMKWARQYAGYVDGYEERLPKNIKSNYKAWENGEKYPTWNQLREVSRKYKIPTAYFFMEKPPKIDDFPHLVNYRKVDTNMLFENNTPELIDNVRKCEIRREIFLDLSSQMDESVLKFRKLDKPLNKYDFSSYIRETLAVPLDLQKTWHKNDSKHYNVLNNWKTLLHDRMGILVFETKNVDIAEMRGLSIFHEDIPIILLNGKDSVNGRIFTLFHELTHLLLGESAFCDGSEERDVEVFCNSVAGEFLVPEHDLKDNCDSNVKKLSNIYGVSEQVISRRLLDVGRITREEYFNNIKKGSHNSFTAKSSGNYLNNMIKYYGRPYYALVLNAWELGVISTSEFMKYSNLNKKSIPKLQEKLFGGI